MRVTRSGTLGGIAFGDRVSQNRVDRLALLVTGDVEDGFLQLLLHGSEVLRLPGKSISRSLTLAPYNPNGQRCSSRMGPNWTALPAAVECSRWDWWGPDVVEAVLEPGKVPWRRLP